MSPISRSEILRLRSLQSVKGRRAERQFLAEGTKLLAELSRSEYKTDHVYSTEKYGSYCSELFSGRCTVIPEKTMSRISAMTTPPGVLAIVNFPDESEFSYDAGTILLLDGISDPGNMGTILRNADWFGVDRVLCMDTCVDIYNPKVVQASMGSIFRLNVQYRSSESLRESVPEEFAVVLAEKDGSRYDEFEFPPNTILVIGSESHGVSEDIRSLSEKSISIPGRTDRAESLNAAVASGILLCHLYHNKQKSP